MKGGILAILRNHVHTLHSLHRKDFYNETFPDSPQAPVQQWFTVAMLVLGTCTKRVCRRDG
jgi:hypothetical protein